MTIVFDATVSGTASNSYPPVVGYNQYRENHGLSALDVAVAQVQLIKSTAFIEARYLGSWVTRDKAVSTQRLHWPQDDATNSEGEDLADDEIPEQILEAVYQYSIKVAAESQTSLDPEAANDLKSLRLDGVVKLDFFGRKKAGALPDSFQFIDQILCGLISSPPGGIKISRIERV